MDTKPRLDRDARREAILDVAAEVFLEEGFDAASMSTIAAQGRRLEEHALQLLQEQGRDLRRAHRALAKAPPWAFALYGGLAAFAAYFSMFAYRKPFTAAPLSTWPAGRSPSTSRSPW
jgi:hypothetical protein